MNRDIETIKKELNEAYEESQKHFEKAPLEPMMNFQELEEYMRPVNIKVSRLSREYRMNVEPKFEDIPDNGQIMMLENFIKDCNDGFFINYDGFGQYIRNNKMSNIEIYPSDVKNNSIRKDFNTIIWFNR